MVELMGVASIIKEEGGGVVVRHSSVSGKRNVDLKLMIKPTFI